MANENMNIIGAGQDTARPAPKINTITWGDCLEVMQGIPDKSVDMILCDLPYSRIPCKWDVVINLTGLWNQYQRIIVDNGAIALTCCQPFTSTLILSNLSQFRYELIWEKNRPPNIFQLRNAFGCCHENIAIFSKANISSSSKYLMKYNPIGVEKSKGIGYTIKSDEKCYTNTSKTKPYMMHGSNYPRSILKYSNCTGRIHPTQKPVALFEYLIRTYTNEGDTVLDNCIGSGTTAIACINTGRNYIGIEKEEKYCKIAEERIHALRSPAQNTMEICHTAPNSAMLQGLKPHAETGTSA